ncbi:MAG: alanine--glyoxylate aminotransferase family protein [Hydrogenobacter sp.]|uniref:pyridoxal-phosphate-dependent aminotransferase family protein n=1 Tax=Hydrogenobacter thermophilus TaxID=940 RepID=UPI0030FABD9F
MYNERLFTPGPVEIPDRVREVLGRQIIHHRTEEFRRIFLEVRELLKRLLDDPSENFVFFSSSGTGAMEAAILNFFVEGDKVLVINGGKFGERWLLLARHWGLDVLEYSVEWGKSADPQKVEETLKRYPECKGVLLQISETSTGSYHPVEDIAQICKNTETLLVADAITALGVYNLKPSIGIDVLIGGSQKALMLPPGLSLLWFSDKARGRLKDRAFYFSVKKELGKQQEGQTAWTPAINLIVALRESLSVILEEGMDTIEKKYRAISEGTRKAINSLGLDVFPEKPAICVTAVRTQDAERIRKELLRHGIRVAGGQDQLKGKIFRISHMGVSDKDGLMFIGMLEVVLRKLGYSPQLGAGISEYSETLIREGLW